jgi:hypothetical protein
MCFSQANDLAVSGQAQGVAGSLRCRFEEVSIRSTRASRHAPIRPSAQPYPRPQRVRLLPGNDPHPRGIGAGLQEQVMDDRCRGDYSCKAVRVACWRPSAAATVAGLCWCRTANLSCLRIFQPTGAQMPRRSTACGGQSCHPRQVRIRRRRHRQSRDRNLAGR